MAHTKVTKTYSQNTGAANTFSYSGSFDVFKATEVVALLDNVALTYTASTINESASPREYSVDTSAKTIHIGGADLSSGVIIIRPETDMGSPTPRATYAPGSSITSEDLNNNQTQLMRKAMEYDEQKLSSTGGTMTGTLTMGEDTEIIFEGATDDAYETTLTVTDPTADRTITLPNVTGTVVTTGDTATVTATMMAANSVDSSELVDGSIDTSHIGASQVTTAKIADENVTTAKIAGDAITGAKIADDAIDSEHYTDGSIDTAHIADSQVTSAKIADGTIVAADLASSAVTTAKIAADAITGAKIADDAIDSEHYVDGSIDNAHIADDTITAAKIYPGTLTITELGDNSVGSGELTTNSVTTAKIVDGNVTTAKIADANVTDAKLASNAVTTAKITDANVTTAKVADDAITIAKVGCEQTTISDSDSHLPTSGAVVDYVAAQLAPIGGLEVIADDESFPNTIPSAGVVISITDAAGLQVNSSGVSTNGDALDNSTITINGFPSELRGGVGSNPDPYVFQSGAGLMVQSTGSSQTYNYHQAMIRESDFVQLSDDINDFNSRYRIHAGEPSSNNDDGDLVWDTNANKMKVYDGTASAWSEVTSTGDFKFLVPVDAGTTTAATWDGSDTSFDLKETSNTGSAASVTNVNQLLISLNGVIQKPNTGTYSGSSEGFYLTDADTIRFCTAPPSGSSAFILQIGSAVSIPTPGDGTVVEAKIGSGAVTTAKIADSNVTTAKIAGDAITGAKIADDAIDSEHYTDGSVDHVHLAADCVDGDNIQDDVINSEHIAAGAVDLEHMSSESVDEDNLHISNAGSNGQFLSKQSGNSGGLTWADASVGGATGTDYNDDVKVRFGTGNDLEIYHDPDVNVINAAAGNLEIRHGAEKNIVATNDGAVELYHDNSKKIETTSVGATVTGNVKSGGVTLQTKWDSDVTYATSRSGGAGFGDTNLGPVSITPKFSTSKMQVQAGIQYRLDDGGSNNNWGALAVYRSNDGGSNWSQVTFGPRDSNGVFLLGINAAHQVRGYYQINFNTDASQTTEVQFKLMMNKFQDGSIVVNETSNDVQRCWMSVREYTD